MMDCSCEYIFKPAVGTHDTVTGEWLPDAVTQHVEHVRDPECEMHGDQWGRCFACEMSMMGGHFPAGKPGWSIRADQKLIACPLHGKFMPPHPGPKVKKR